jgi:hypothetical protein
LLLGGLQLNLHGHREHDSTRQLRTFVAGRRQPSFALVATELVEPSDLRVASDARAYYRRPADRDMYTLLGSGWVGHERIASELRRDGSS